MLQIQPAVRPMVNFDLGPHEIDEADIATHRILTLNFKHFLTAEMASSLFGFKSAMDESLKEVYIMLNYFVWLVSCIIGLLCINNHMFVLKYSLFMCFG